MKVAILGFSREGRSTLGFLKKAPAFRGAEIWVLDENAETNVPRGVKSSLGENYLKNLKNFNVVFRSPGVPYNLPELKEARRQGVKFSSATRLFFNKCPAKVVGVTGTKGKGTTSTLLYKILKAAGKKVFLAGNIGKPALDILPRLSALSRRGSAFAVLELSSFQLQDLDRSPHIAVVLDIFPDHQDAHSSLKEYYEAKANITRHQSKADKAFYFKDNERSSEAARQSPGRKIGVDARTFRLLRPSDLKIIGWHNFKNAAMAYTVAKNLGVPDDIIIKTIKNFRGLEHRLELVGEVKTSPCSRCSRADPRGLHYVYFYNDSASTNPHTAAAAVRAFSEHDSRFIDHESQIILLAGGYDKGLDYSPLADALKNSRVKIVILFGENRKKIAKAIRRIKNCELRIIVVKNLPTAVKTAYRFVAKPVIHNSSFVILFSPGAASFDQFEDYADRGRKFKKLVRGLRG